MKKFFSVILFFSFLSGSIVSQNDSENKNFRFGLRASPQLNWLRSNNNKLYEKSGMAFGFGFGLDLEFRLSKVAHILTGIGGDFLGGKQIYKSTDGYGYSLNKDNDILQNQDENWNLSSDNYLNKLKSRRVKTTYVNLPIAIKLMTKELSGMKYYGVFGGDIGILTKIIAQDEVEQVDAIVSTDIRYKPVSTNSDLNISKDCIPVKLSWKVGAGAEYNLSGTTNLFFGINYVRCFTNLYRSESKYLVSDFEDAVKNGTFPRKSAKQGAFGDGIILNLGILF